jgi:nicotinate-nucleotide pyrophosphorylase (carboxylating)
MLAEEYHALIDLALEEDLGKRGDITSRAIFTDESSSASLTSKDTGVLAGSGIFSAVYRRIDPKLEIRFLKQDGQLISSGERIAEIGGLVRSVLLGERTALNFLSFLSGVATLTRRYVETTGGKCVILDTRKTLPGYRKLSKYAVRVGGGENHRMGLYDMALIKDNHIDRVGSVKEAVARVRAKWKDEVRIEVECRTIEEVKEALASHVDLIMLDNMDVEMMSRAVALGRGMKASKSSGASFEASGGIRLDRIEPVAASGVDYISVGAITNSVRAFDFSLTVEHRGGHDTGPS